MNNNHDSKFSTGFLLGLLIGGGAVFLLGTRTGKNLLKIVSEQGLDGLLGVLEDYDLADLEEYEDEEVPEEVKTNGHAVEKPQEKVVKESYKETPKRRFFKRVRRG
ncbi:hypothetical protein M1307_03710 [Patescibacteria group bacterium]|nr:hypothetical protein [Patescibacteria group bacterium]